MGALAIAITAAAIAAMMIVGLLFVARRARLGVDQRLPVGDRDLVIVGMDFGKRQIAVAVAAVLDEGRL